MRVDAAEREKLGGSFDEPQRQFARRATPWIGMLTGENVELERVYQLMTKDVIGF